MYAGKSRIIRGLKQRKHQRCYEKKQKGGLSTGGLTMAAHAASAAMVGLSIYRGVKHHIKGKLASIQGGISKMVQ